MKKKEMSVGVFDSGLGGVSVLKELKRLMPNENFIYYGDTANAPYGVKSVSDVRKLTFAVYENLRRTGALKAFVIACNTATSAAVAALREAYPEDIIIGVEPALKPAVLSSAYPTVAVLATPLTLKEEKFALLLKKYENEAEVIPFACPGLVEFVERGEVSGEALHAFLSELLAPLKDRGLDAVVLGCTHYPFVAEEISSILGKDVLIFDGSEGTARETKRRLEMAGLLNGQNGIGSVTFMDSSYPDIMNPNESLLTSFGGDYLCN